MKLITIFARRWTGRILRYSTPTISSLLLLLCYQAVATESCRKDLGQDYNGVRFRVSTDTRPVAVVVDGTSAGNEYAPLLRAKGYRVIHLKSGNRDTEIDSSFVRSDYDDYLENSDHTETLRVLRNEKPKLVVAGEEAGVSLAHSISQTLDIPFRNIDELSPTWRDKAEALKVLKQKGLLVADFANVGTWNEAVEWAEQHAKWPIVVKPLSSAGTDGVTFAYNMAQLEVAFQKIYGKNDKFKSQNQSVLLMEYLKGPEYTVNLVMKDGVPIVSDVWYYERPIIEGAATLYDYDRLVSFNEAEKLNLIAYAVEVAKSLGIQNGPAHVEVKITEDGPRLVEMAARACGGGLGRVTKLATGRNQISLSVDAFHSPAALKAEPFGYSLHKEAAVVFLTSAGGKRLSSEMLEEIRNWPGVESVQINSSFKDGDLLPRSIDSESVFGQINILHEDPKVVDALIQQIRQLRDTGAFEQEP